MHLLRPRDALALAALLLLGTGCSCGAPRPEPPQAQPDQGDQDDVPVTLLRVTAGPDAADQVLEASQIPYGCAPGDRSEGSVRIGADRGLADVIASLKRGPQLTADPPSSPPAPSDRLLRIDDCGLVPRSLAVAKGDTLVLSNGDQRFHTVHLWRLDGGRERSLQTIALAPGEADVRFVLEQAGLYRLRSDQIPWLRGLLLVQGAGERALITDADGTAEASDLQPGSWDVRLIHETLGETDTTVEIAPGGSAAIYGTLPAP